MSVLGLAATAAKVGSVALKDGAASSMLEGAAVSRGLRDKLAGTLLGDGSTGRLQVSSEASKTAFDAESWRQQLREGYDALDSPEARVSFVRQQLLANPQIEMQHRVHIFRAIKHLGGVEGFDGNLRLLAADLETPVFKGAWSEIRVLS